MLNEQIREWNKKERGMQIILLRANRLDVFRGHSIPNGFVFLLILSNRG